MVKFTSNPISVGALALTLGALTTHAFNDEEARSKSVYQIVTDRFAVTESSAPACNATERKYCGGSWQGVSQHLDYIQGMGFDTSESCWRSPGRDTWLVNAGNRIFADDILSSVLLGVFFFSSSIRIRV